MSALPSYEIFYKVIAGVTCDFSNDLKFKSKTRTVLSKSTIPTAIAETEALLAEAGFVEIPEFRRNSNPVNKTPRKVFIEKQAASQYTKFAVLDFIHPT